MAAYLVTTKNSDGTISERLVEARTGSQAVNFVVDGNVTAKTLNTGDLIKHINQGLKIETVPAEKTVPVAAAAATVAADAATGASPAAVASQATKDEVMGIVDAAKPAEKKSGLFHKKSA